MSKKDKDKDEQERLERLAGLAMQASIIITGLYVATGKATPLSSDAIARRSVEHAKALMLELDKLKE